MMRSRRPTLLLSLGDVRSLLDIGECIAEVEKGFRSLGEGRVPPPEILGLHAPEGGLHVKAAVWPGDPPYFVAKLNANFPQNPKRYGLPTIQGVIAVYDAADGELLALLDSIEITAQRTAAATAVAAKYLAREDAQTLFLAGCGRQGLMHLRAIRAVRPFTKLLAYDVDPAASDKLAEQASSEMGIRAERVDDLSRPIANSDMVVTCTSATKFIVAAQDARPGTFIGAVGADNERKQEIDPRLFPKAKVVVDSVAQCAQIGDLHHAIAAGTVTAEQVHAELAQVVAGRKAGRQSDGEITLFDSTGIAIEDAAASVYVYEKAVRSGFGSEFSF